jgi:molecular chaperone DnaJ
VPKADGTAGDLIVTVDIAVPSRLSDRATFALSEFRNETSDFDPRAELMRKTDATVSQGEH